MPARGRSGSAAPSGAAASARRTGWTTAAAAPRTRTLGQSSTRSYQFYHVVLALALALAPHDLSGFMARGMRVRCGCDLPTYSDAAEVDFPSAPAGANVTTSLASAEACISSRPEAWVSLAFFSPSHFLCVSLSHSLLAPASQVGCSSRRPSPLHYLSASHPARLQGSNLPRPLPAWHHIAADPLD